MKQLGKARSRISIRHDTEARERAKVKTQLIRVQMPTYKTLSAMRIEFRLPTTELVAAMVDAAQRKRAVDFKAWRDEMPANGRMTPQQRWAEVEKTIWNSFYLSVAGFDAGYRHPVEELIIDTADMHVSKPQVERSLHNWKAEGIVKIDFTRNEVWCENLKESNELLEARLEALGLIKT